jgi:hypothetical protein
LASFTDVYLFEYDSKEWNPKAPLPGSIAGELGNKIYGMARDGKKNIGERYVKDRWPAVRG